MVFRQKKMAKNFWRITIFYEILFWRIALVPIFVASGQRAESNSTVWVRVLCEYEWKWRKQQ